MCQPSYSELAVIEGLVGEVGYVAVHTGLSGEKEYTTLLGWRLEVGGFLLWQANKLERRLEVGGLRF